MPEDSTDPAPDAPPEPPSPPVGSDAAALAFARRSVLIWLPMPSVVVVVGAVGATIIMSVISAEYIGLLSGLMCMGVIAAVGAGITLIIGASIDALKLKWAGALVRAMRTTSIIVAMLMGAFIFLSIIIHFADGGEGSAFMILVVAWLVGMLVITLNFGLASVVAIAGINSGIWRSFRRQQAEIDGDEGRSDWAELDHD